MKTNKNGYTLMELLLTLSIILILVSLGIPQLKSLLIRLEVQNGVRSVTIAISRARYEAIRNNRSIKLCVEKNQMLLVEKKADGWSVFLPLKKKKNVIITANTNPVFSPLGSVSPLCSFKITNKHFCFKVTISIAGRIKVKEIR